MDVGGGPESLPLPLRVTHGRAAGEESRLERMAAAVAQFG